MFGQVQEQIRSYVEWLRLLVEALGALVIAAGIVLVVIALVRDMLPGKGRQLHPDPPVVRALPDARAGAAVRYGYPVHLSVACGNVNNRYAGLPLRHARALQRFERCNRYLMLI